MSSSKTRTLIQLFLSYFFILFSYPFVRSSTQAFFYESYTSAEYPLATFVGIIILSISIFFSNKIQKKLNVNSVFAIISFSVITLLLVSYLLLSLGVKEAAFALFALKESYIVLLVHVSLAYFNNHVDINDLKKYAGPLGAAGSIGGILGGQSTKYLAQSLGTEIVFYTSLVAIAMAGIVFFMLETSEPVRKEKLKKSPLASLKEVKVFAILIGSIVALSQFIIFITDLEFQIIFEKIVTSKDERTAFLGNFYSIINTVTIFIQFLILPTLLKKIKTKSIFYFIPIILASLIFLGLGLGAGSLIVIGGVFISMKAIDYSIFSTVKEVMYHSLEKTQKYGVKYITDMFVYRSSKAFIAFFFAVFAIKDTLLLNIIQAVSLVLWLYCAYLLFKKQGNKIQ